MDSLIQITVNNQGNLAVSAREMYDFFCVKERFSKWFERQVSFGLILNQDYTPYQMVHPQNKQEAEDYTLTLDTAKEIAMIQRSEKGKLARQYFIECEKKLQNQNLQLKNALEVALRPITERLDNLEKSLHPVQLAEDLTPFEVPYEDHHRSRQIEKAKTYLKRQELPGAFVPAEVMNALGRNAKLSSLAFASSIFQTCRAQGKYTKRNSTIQSEFDVSLNTINNVVEALANKELIEVEHKMDSTRIIKLTQKAREAFVRESTALLSAKGKGWLLNT